MSIATEITRLQNAKASLKTSINAKTDSEHQIADETLEDYASFVDSIQTGGIPTPRLPNEYQEVEYIENTGSQYINTGVVLTNGFRIETQINISNWYSEGNFTGVCYYAGVIGANTYRDYIVVYKEKPMLGMNTDTQATSTLSLNTWYTIDASTISGNGYYKIDETTVTSSSNAVSHSNLNLWLFGVNNNNDGKWWNAYIKMKETKIYNNSNTLVRDLVPCYRKSDNAIGMYDLTNDTFYANSGTGTFSKGDNVYPTGLQSKSVTITTNTTTLIVPDDGYNALGGVSVTTNVTEPTPDYVSNGLIAWYEGEDNFDSNEHLNSRVGNDYLYVYSRLVGNSTTNPVKTYNGNIVNLGGYVYASSRDYFVNGYTIEIVGYTTGSSNASTDGCWLYTGNTNQTAGIGAVTTNGNYIIFQNDGTTTSSYQFTRNKPFNASVYFKTNIGRGTNVSFTTKGSVNGQGYVEYTGASNYHNVKTGGQISLFLSYYADNYKGYGGIKSIRVYNRALTDQEMYNNYLVDKARFDLD